MNASMRIYDKESSRLYKRVGKKYAPCNDPYALDGLREGWWLVKIGEGFKSMRACVYPAKAELQAAIKDKEDKIVDIILECTNARPKEGVPMSDQARKDWQWFIDKHGKEFNILYYPSFAEAAEKIVKALTEK